MTDAFDDATLRFYRGNAAAYAERKPAGGTLARFLGEMPAGGRILELGCGAGHHAEAMLAAGFDVDATDGSPEMAAEASRRLGRPARTLLFHQLDADAAYDGVWAYACLLHVPRDELGGVLGRIHRALKPGGLFYASFKSGEAEGRDKLARYYNYPSEDWLRARYAEAGPWTALTVERSEGKGFDQELASFLHVSARKPAA
ncbi:class I SAM-dependent methyltransferase [Rhodopseudomonas palustris]|uniref:Class I SAM-dependent methyltransferase n=1 Tax=Rhodopseudomonas palustris TaxID=1076 RepID=A0A418VJ60_RHOPL|nr:class I SAM-dependent methyltransferase [Rhodopseudomonas palustris]RJF76200.1 class I SAM-dependent methyltransferase [Rhodopseudomonas palustris]